MMEEILFHQCLNLYCVGVVEFVGVSLEAGSSYVAPMPSIQEKDVFHSSEEFLMVYKCSRCGKVEYRANQQLANRMNAGCANRRALPM